MIIQWLQLEWQELKIPNILEAQQEILDEEDSIYDINGIDFDEIHCSFAKSITQGLSSEIAQRLMAKKKNILVVKGKKEYYPRTLEVIEKIKSNNIVTQVLKVTCYNDMKYKPYGFFYDLIAGIYGYSITGKIKEQNNFAPFIGIDDSGFIKDMINLNAREFTHP